MELKDKKRLTINYCAQTFRNGDNTDARARACMCVLSFVQCILVEYISLLEWIGFSSVEHLYYCRISQFQFTHRHISRSYSLLHSIVLTILCVCLCVLFYVLTKYTYIYTAIVSQSVSHFLALPQTL